MVWCLHGLLVLCLISIFFSSPAYSQRINCCAFTDPYAHPPFVNQYWYVLSPPDVFMECTTPVRSNYFNNFASQNIFGYAWELNGCQIPSSDCPAGQIVPVTYNDDGTDYTPWCNEDDGLYYSGFFKTVFAGVLDDDGGGANNFMDSFVDSQIGSFPCGGNSGAITFERIWTSFTTCNGPYFPFEKLTIGQFITIQDTTPPTVGVPNDITVECGVETTDPSFYQTAIGNDRCNPTQALNPTSQFQSSTSGCGNTKSVTTTWTFTDGCNINTGSQTITSVDTIPPYATGYFDETFPCTVNYVAASQQKLVAYDLCTSNPTISGPVATTTFSPQCNQNLQYVQTWTITDACALSTTVSSTISVYDVFPPVITTPSSDSEQYLLCYELLPAPLTMVASDSCSPTVNNQVFTTVEIVEYEFDSQLSIFFPNLRPIGSAVLLDAYKRTVVRNYTSTDQCGNEAFFVQKFYVEQVSDVEIVLSSPNGTISTKVSSDTLSFGVTVLITSCSVYNLRIIFDAYPLEVVSINGSPVPYEYGYFFYDFGSKVAPGSYSFTVKLQAPYILSEDYVEVSFVAVAQSRIITSNSPTFTVIVN